MLITKDNICIRKMTFADLHLMEKWLNNPKVLEFYEEPPSDLERVTNKYGPRIEGKHYVSPCIVEYNQEPIGYMQYYKLQENDLRKYNLPPNQSIYGIDQFIGEPDLWGKGIGTAMVRLLLDYLSESKAATKVVLDVKKNNKRAISSYKKCLFQIVEELDSDSYLMVWAKDV